MPFTVDFTLIENFAETELLIHITKPASNTTQKAIFLRLTDVKPRLFLDSAFNDGERQSNQYRTVYLHSFTNTFSKLSFIECLQLVILTNFTPSLALFTDHLPGP